MARILLVTEHKLLREALVVLLQSQQDFEVHQSDCFGHAVSILEKPTAFDLVLLDCNLPEMHTARGTKLMKSLSRCPVALLCDMSYPLVAHLAIESGAAGLVTKCSTAEQALTAINTMLNGDVLYPEIVLPEDFVALTQRENDVLKRLVKGKLNKEIAHDLDIQEVTVKLHVNTLSRKLSAKNRTHAAMRARDLGLL